MKYYNIMADLLAKENEEKQLKYYTVVENKKIEDLDTSHEFGNLSITEIARNISKTFNSVLDDLIMLKNKNIKKKTSMMNEVFVIIIKEDRLIYLGILLFFFSLCFIFI
jgi:hypothetical protein